MSQILLIGPLFKIGFSISTKKRPTNERENKHSTYMLNMVFPNCGNKTTRVEKFGLSYARELISKNARPGVCWLESRIKLPVFCSCFGLCLSNVLGKKK